MSIQIVLNKINKLLLQIKYSLKEGDFNLPLIRCRWQFDFDKKTLVRSQPTAITFKRNTISLTLRIVQILTIVRDLLANNKYITKRNLYYQLVKYYAYYAILDSDLMIICDSLKIQRSALNIIVSSKLQIFWFPQLGGQQRNVVEIQLMYKKDDMIQLLKRGYINMKILLIIINKHHLFQNSISFFNLTRYSKFQTVLNLKLVFYFLITKDILYPFNLAFQFQTINFLIMQKQSLFEILSESLNYKAPQNKQNWLLVNSKGYADMTAFRFINEIFKVGKYNKNIRFYYIGDYDAYGIDIMLNYAIGNETFRGLWSQLKWLCLFDKLVQYQDSHMKSFSKQKFEKSEYRKQTAEDKKKMREMLSREYFEIQNMQQLHLAKSTLQQERDCDGLFMSKARKWRGFIQQLLEKDYQCEVESYFKNLLHPFDVIELMIEREFYI